MPFFRMKRMKWPARIAGFFLAVMAGCAVEKTEKINPVEKSLANTSEKNAALSAGRQISAVDVEAHGQNLVIRIQGNQKLVYTSIKQAFPFGIAIYLLETQIADNFKKNISENKSVSDLIVKYADEDQTTVKVEVLLKEDLNYEVIETGSVLKVALIGAMEESQVAVDEPAVPSQTMVGKSPQETADLDPGFDKTAIMTGIEFNTQPDGKSDIIVQTSHPVRYDITPGDDNNLYLNLYNTILPDYHKRPLLTQYFNSAVESLLPVQVPGKEKTSAIQIKIRDQVPYRLVRNQNTLSLSFEPSKIKPPVFNKARKQVVGEAQNQVQTPVNSGEAISMAAKKKTREQEIFGSPKKYTGEKIKLDFYETDIKNVFRILRSVGGLNFAIDKDVEGKVTLTLENAVPWDQVMDLILKMNSLGQKKEGNVIRIATLNTLQKEEKLIQESIAARKKTLEQKKSFEPLITEYIPINYSDADVDIKPHLSQILSKGRGQISVDKRTNMVIITDVQSKIDQAREIIYRLDKVTPQIMIEAKVVEVTKDFSRELGIGLSLSKTQTAFTGRSQDFEVALNSPIGSAVNTGSFNFYRILGSNFLNLNAQIAASETKGDVKVISSPRILTLDNKKAKIKQGLEYAYLERDDTGGSSVKFKNIDLLLEVTPHVTPDKRIAMNVYLTKNDIDSITNGVPSLSTNEAETELLVNDNDTIVIGGIVKTTDSKSTSGTPILSGIPVLGRLFRTDTDKDKRNELLIFITPSIVQLEQKRNTFTTAD